jgi:nucleotide-binding universal stress UspA family protein
MSASVAFRRIVVPADFSVSAEGAWALAQQLARATGSERRSGRKWSLAPDRTELRRPVRHQYRTRPTSTWTKFESG